MASTFILSTWNEKKEVKKKQSWPRRDFNLDRRTRINIPKHFYRRLTILPAHHPPDFVKDKLIFEKLIMNVLKSILKICILKIFPLKQGVR